MDKTVNANFIPLELYKEIIKNMPIIAVDLLIINQEGKYLLGRRRNRPASGHFFVPGGRLYKGEKIQNAIKRIMKNEVGANEREFDPLFIGFFEHFYNECFWDNGINSHFISLAFKIIVNDSIITYPLEQHDKFCWMTSEEIIENKKVHPYCKDYWLKKSHSS